MPFTAQETKNLRGLGQAKRNIAMIKSRIGIDAANVFRRAGLIIANSAQQILTVKGHIVTGALRRSLTAQVTNVTLRGIEVSVGSDRAYAEDIEMLPDGGYLFEAFEKQRAVVIRYIGDEYKRALNRSIQL